MPKKTYKLIGLIINIFNNLGKIFSYIINVLLLQKVYMIKKKNT